MANPTVNNPVNFKFGTLAQYNALTTKSEDTLYFVTDGTKHRLFLGTSEYCQVTDPEIFKDRSSIATLTDRGFYYLNDSSNGRTSITYFNPEYVGGSVGSFEFTIEQDDRGGLTLHVAGDSQDIILTADPQSSSGTIKLSDTVRWLECIPVFCSSSTASNTAAKVAVTSQESGISEGCLLFVKFTYGNSVSGTVTLTIKDGLNNTLASGNIVSNLGSTSRVFGGWSAGETAIFYYDGTNFVLINNRNHDATTLIIDDGQTGVIGISADGQGGALVISDIHGSSPTTARISGVSTPTANTDAANKQYVDNKVDSYLLKSGGTMTGGITMGANKVTTTATTFNNNELVTKKYVDDAISGVSGAPTWGSIA